MTKKRSAIQIIAQNNPNLKNTEIADIVCTSKMTVSRWKSKITFNDKIRKRKTKMSKDIKNILLKRAANKFSGVNKASSRQLSKDIKKKFHIDISHGTINLWLKKLLKRPIKAKKTFYLRDKDKRRRLEFYDMIKEKNISGKDIFFNDEKRFILNPPLNKQTRSF